MIPAHLITIVPSQLLPGGRSDRSVGSVCLRDQRPRHLLVKRSWRVLVIGDMAAGFGGREGRCSKYCTSWLCRN